MNSSVTKNLTAKIILFIYYYTLKLFSILMEKFISYEIFNCTKLLSIHATNQYFKLMSRKWEMAAIYLRTGGVVRPPTLCHKTPIPPDEPLKGQQRTVFTQTQRPVTPSLQSFKDSNTCLRYGIKLVSCSSQVWTWRGGGKEGVWVVNCSNEVLATGNHFIFCVLWMPSNCYFLTNCLVVNHCFVLLDNKLHPHRHIEMHSAYIVIYFYFPMCYDYHNYTEIVC